MANRSFKIFRFDPSRDRRPYFSVFTIDIRPAWTIVDCLNQIRRMDPAVTFRRSCQSGICGSCAMNINGKNRLACETMADTIRGKTITIRPLPHFEIIKDLVVDLSCFYETFEKVAPLAADSAAAGKKEHLQSPGDREKLDGLYECIMCASCTSSCPLFWFDKHYTGPASLLKMYRYVADSRDNTKSGRLRSVDASNSAWRCHTIFNCVEACPKNLNPGSAIQKLKLGIVLDNNNSLVER